MLAQHKAALYLSAAIKWLLTALLMLWLPTSVLASTENHNGYEVDDELLLILKNAVEATDSFDDKYDAQVWLMDKSNRMSRFSKDPQQRLSLLRSIHRAATRADLNPEVVLAVIEVESHFNRFAVSSVGAQGMMQVMPFWKNEIGRADDNLIDLETNLRYGCTILKHYIKRSDGHLANALARYNGSYGSYRYSSKVMDAWDKWR